MTLLRALPLPTAQRLTGTGSPVESLRRAGFRAKVIAGWLNVWEGAPLTPGVRYTPRERPAEVNPPVRVVESHRHKADAPRKVTVERCVLTEWSVAWATRNRKRAPKVAREVDNG